MLVLFDIDGTLLFTGPGGLDAVAETWLELFGTEIRPSGDELAGNLDPLIQLPRDRTHEGALGGPTMLVEWIVYAG